MLRFLFFKSTIIIFTSYVPSRIWPLSSPRTTDTWWLNPQFFAAQIQISIPNKYLGFGYKALVFCWNIGWLTTHCTKIGADSKYFENTPNVPKFICPNCLPKPKSLGFRWKKASLDVRSPWYSPSQLGVLTFYAAFNPSMNIIHEHHNLLHGFSILLHFRIHCYCCCYFSPHFSFCLLYIGIKVKVIFSCQIQKSEY